MTVNNFKSNHAKIYPLVRNLIDVQSNDTQDKDAIAVINIHQLGPIVGAAKTIGMIISNSNASDETKKLAIDVFASSITLTQLGTGSLPKEVASLAYHAGEEVGKISPKLLKTIVESLQTSSPDHRNQHPIGLVTEPLKKILSSGISSNNTPTLVSTQKGKKI